MDIEQILFAVIIGPLFVYYLYLAAKLLWYVWKDDYWFK